MKLRYSLVSRFSHLSVFACSTGMSVGALAKACCSYWSGVVLSYSLVPRPPPLPFSDLGARSKRSGCR